MVARAIGIAMVVALASGCLRLDEVQCADGRLCPPGSRCDDVRGGCIFSTQLEACDSIAEGGDCQIDGAAGSCSNGACIAWFCGDGALNGGEACEGTDFGGMTCLDFGFSNPDGLACSDSCRINKDACTGGCGDNVKDQTELCDGTDIPAGTTCKTLGFYDEVGLACSGFCTFDISACTGFCGDGVSNGPEQCDAVPPAGDSCLDYSFDAGRLGCTLCAPGFEGCRSFGWRRVASPTAQRLRGIWGTSSNDFYVVGLAGTLLRYNGSQLAAITPSPTSDDLNAIWGANATTVFAVGGSGTILRFDGSSWTSTTISGSPTLAGVWGSGPSDIYAVGLAGKILHYTGAWSEVTGTGVGTSDLRAVWGSGGHVFAVGAGGRVVHYNGASWTTTTVAAGAEFYAVWGTAANDVFAAGNDGTGAILYRYNGATWSPVSSGPLNGRYAALWGSATNDAFAVGTSLLHHDGSKWTPLLAPSEVQAGVRLWAIWGSPTGDVFAAGDNGYIARWGGASWTAASSGTTINLRSVSAAGASDAIAVGFSQDQAIVTNVSRKYDGVTWSAVPTPTSTDSLYSVWYAGADVAYAVGDASNAGIIYHLNGASWTNIPSGDPKNCGGLPSPALRAVWGTSSSNVLAVGFDGAFRRFETCWSTPAAQPATADPVLGIFGASAADVFATTSSSSVFRFDNASWTSLPAIPSPPSYLASSWASNANDVFSVGDAIVHYDGSTWARMTADGMTLRAVSGTGPRNVFAVGANSLLLHYDGVSWTPIRVPTTAPTDLRGVAATPRSLIVVGDNGFVQRLSFSLRPSEVNCRDAWDDDGDGMPDCADSDCASDDYCKRGGACSATRDLACGDTITASTLGRTPGRDYYTCDPNAQTGPEAIYRLVPSTTGTATATLSAFAPAELDLVVVGAMAATDGCDPDVACLGASSMDATATEAVTFATTAGRPSYIVVEGRNAAAGPFTLEVTCQ